ncbi:AAA family ATPase [Sphingomonas sp. JC676]|uniref:AAA family ATPase n=1 Tax=Sphingomonas sp. JC676 TaxID=2768065 RepID=UPI001657E133|nr:AAA family ATPase [Sphingomonas sp. JC676]MBC9033488.1 AAA family ATPase [Sphingomonas sp. JC676]
MRKRVFVALPEFLDLLQCAVTFSCGDPADRNLEAHVDALNSQIDLNNAAIDNFASEQASARDKLKRHYLTDQQSGHLSAVALEATNKDALVSSQNSLQRIREQITDVRAQLRTHGPAATELNRLLKGYLGHSHISFEPVENGYKVCRNKQESIKPLGEGEKTAVAFCYFLTSLAAEGRNIDDTIVVLDDPISSLDARAMTHVVGTIRRLFKIPFRFLFSLTT